MKLTRNVAVGNRSEKQTVCGLNSNVSKFSKDELTQNVSHTKSAEDS